MTESEKLKMNELADLAEELTAELQQMETTILTQKAKIQKQSSDNLKLQQTLQKASLQIQNQAEKIKSLNEKIESLSESDLQLKKAEEMMKEADRKYIQIKKIMREQYKKMEDNANKKKKLDEKQKNIDLIVNSKLKNKLSIEIIKLDKKYKIWLILLLIYGIGLTIIEIKKTGN